MTVAFIDLELKKKIIGFIGMTKDFQISIH